MEYRELSKIGFVVGITVVLGCPVVLGNQSSSDLTQQSGAQPEKLTCTKTEGEERVLVLKDRACKVLVLVMFMVWSVACSLHLYWYITCRVCTYINS